MLKKFICIVLVIKALFVFASCCTKKQCLGFDDLQGILLLQFDEKEVDSISIEVLRMGQIFQSDWIAPLLLQRE